MTIPKFPSTIFSVVGFPPDQSANMHLRAQLMIEVEVILKARKMTQVEAAALFVVSQPRVSNLLKGRIDKFTLDTLINWLSKLGRRVELVVPDGDGSASVPKRL